MLIEYPFRFWLILALFVCAAFAVGQGESALAFLAAAFAIMLLPGVLRRLPKAQPEENADAPPQPLDQSLDTVSLDALADAALVVSMNHDVYAANEAARDLIGAALAEDVRLAIRHPIALEAVEAAIQTGEEQQCDLESFGGGQHPYRLRVAPIDEARLLLTFVNAAPVRASEVMRSDFVANASHELRTPLATVGGFIETLQGPAADDEAARKRFLKVMGEETSRMTRLIDDLLSLSRIERNKSLQPRTRTDILELVEAFTDTFKLSSGDEGPQIVIDAEAGLPPVLADRDQLFQVLRNLVSNALKYGRAGAPVTIAIERLGTGVRVSIADEGEGISSEHLPRLTERFYRVDPSRSRELGGTGLGLAIVKHIIERHRGRMEIQSRVGIGTTVSFTLPHARDAPRIERPTEPLLRAE
ncbi:MAG: ATP-binding protein [Pacificimonas sp.]|jgi:two-component system phosphate regulon sensor histidine kinase PhoR|nr:ATP-binding protein [Pacificimonas sp.]